MNPISAFFVRNIIPVFFIYGLVFFALGLALALASQRTSALHFARAIRPLAAFGLLHSLHEWIEMFQKIAALSGGYTPPVSHEITRLLILVLSLLMLIAFGIVLLNPEERGYRPLLRPLLLMAGLWLSSTGLAAHLLHLSATQAVAAADALARYSLGIPGALLGSWALMTQQRIFREYEMPQFGRDLVWSAAALFLYGVFGQIFVRETALLPTMIVNSTRFLQWFGIPIQLFRAAMAAVMAVFMVRALNAFELESQRQIQQANEARLLAQANALEAERRTRRERERLNAELQRTAHELSLALDLTNLLAQPMSLPERLHSALDRLVGSLQFANAGMILLTQRETGVLQVLAAIGFSDGTDRADTPPCAGMPSGRSLYCHRPHRLPPSRRECARS